MNVQLVTQVELKSKKLKFSFSGRPIKSLDLTMQTWGYSGRVRLRLSAEHTPEKFQKEFLGDSVWTVTVSIKPVYPTEGKVAPEEIEVIGIISGRSMVENESENRAKGSRVTTRDFEFWFVDRAQFYWTKHFPIELYTQTSESEVIQKHASSDWVLLTIDHKKLTQKQDQIFVALGESNASFWDYIHWVAERSEGVFFYDYVAAKNMLTNDKPPFKEKAQFLRDDLERIVIQPYENTRHSIRLKNSNTEANSVNPIENKYSEEALFTDRLMRTSIPAEVDDRKTLLARTVYGRKPTMVLTHKRFPKTEVYPGLGYVFRPEEWEKDRFGLKDKFNCLSVTLSATASGDDATIVAPSTPSAVYDCVYQSHWEDSTETAVLRADYEPMRLPRAVEGKIVTESGKDEERVYEFKIDSVTQRQTYRVKVPLWKPKGQNKKEDGVIIDAPMHPQYSPGFIYVPHYKNERVLLNLFYSHADIVSSLEWAPGIQPPQDTLGQGLVFGKNAGSHTEMTHVYEDEKPKFLVSRNDKGDLQTITLTENTLTLEVKQGEDDGQKTKN